MAPGGAVESPAAAPGAVAVDSPAGPHAAPAGPQEDPAYQGLVRQFRARATEAKTPVKTPRSKQADTVSAAALTAAETGQQHAYESHLDQLSAAQPRPLTVDGFMEEFKATTEKLASALPATKNQHDSDDTDVQVEQAHASAKQDAAAQTSARAEPLRNEAAKNSSDYQAPQSQAPAPRELHVDPAGQPAEIKHAAAAAPKPKTDAEISLDDKSRSLDAALTNHSVGGQTIDIDERSLALPVSGEPSFDEAGAAKQKAQDEIAKAGPRYRAEEGAVIGASQKEIQSAVDTGLEGQHATREKSFGEVLGAQNQHKAALEGKKRAVFVQIEGIYTKTKGKVTEELAKVKGLDEIFDGILKDAQDYFNRSVKQQLEYIYTPGTFDYSDWKDEHEREIKEEWENQKRRGSDGGGGFPGLDPAYLGALKVVRDRSAESYFKSARIVFMGDVNRQVEQKIAKPVVEALNAAKRAIQEGRDAVNAAFATLDPKEQEEAKNVLDAVVGRFDQLNESVDDQQKEIIGDLARTYSRSLGKLQATFDEIKKDVLTSWWEKAWNKLKAVVNAIIDFATRLVELLGRLAYLVGDIVSSPRAFFRNLVSGIGQGFSTFIGSIGKFLATAFFDWLRGSSGVSVQMPKDLGPQGIFGLFTQLLNLGTETIWERMEIVYDKTIANAFRRGEVLLDRGLEIFQIVRTEGLGGLWDEIRNSLGTILDDTLDMIKENVLYAAVKKVILEVGKMLVPGGGFIAIAEKIFRLLQFIVEARDKILDLIEAFVDSVEMAVKGNVSGIVDHITGALTKFITLALDFLVGLFGLSNLKDKVTGFIERMRAPVVRGIDWVLNKLKPLVMKGKKVVERGKEKVVGAGKAIVQVGVPKDPHERLTLAANASIAAARKLTGKVTKGLLKPVLAAIRLRYGLTAIEPYQEGGTWWVRLAINPDTKRDTGVKATIAGETVIFRVSGDEVTVEREGAGKPEATIRKEHRAAQIQTLLDAFGWDESHARELLGIIRRSQLTPLENKSMLLAAFAKEPLMEGPTGKEKLAAGWKLPENWVRQLFRFETTSPAAVASLPGSDIRARLVHLGEVEVGGEIRQPLSRYAVVFQPRHPGAWMSRHNEPAGMTEYIFNVQGAAPETISIATIEVDNDGQVIRIMDVNEKLGRAEVIRLMRSNGWVVSKAAESAEQPGAPAEVPEPAGRR